MEMLARHKKVSSSPKRTNTNLGASRAPVTHARSIFQAVLPKPRLQLGAIWDADSGRVSPLGLLWSVFRVGGLDTPSRKATGVLIRFPDTCRISLTLAERRGEAPLPLVNGPSEELASQNTLPE